MNHFEKFNFKVVPCDKNKRPTVAWSEPTTWCDWEERDEIYGKHDNWYVIPARYVSYESDGITWKVFVIDIDKHDGDKFDEALKFVKEEWRLPTDTLIVKTPSGGLHMYYRCLDGYTPNTIDMRRINSLPIEIKSSVGVVAPNGIDRKVVRDMPIAILNPVQGTPFGDAVTCLKRAKPQRDYVENPNFNIDEIEIRDVSEGNRHRMCLGTIQYLKDRGCPKELAIDWGEKFMDYNGRKLQRNEIENMWDWQGNTQQPVIIDGKKFKEIK